MSSALKALAASRASYS